MIFIFVHQLIRHSFISVQSIHNELSRLFLSRCKYNDIISKSQMVDLSSSHTHIESLITMVLMKMIQSPFQYFNTQDEQSWGNRVPLFKTPSGIKKVIPFTINNDRVPIITYDNRNYINNHLIETHSSHNQICEWPRHPILFLSHVKFDNHFSTFLGFLNTMDNILG